MKKGGKWVGEKRQKGGSGAETTMLLSLHFDIHGIGLSYK